MDLFTLYYIITPFLRDISSSSSKDGDIEKIARRTGYGAVFSCGRGESIQVL